MTYYEKACKFAKQYIDPVAVELDADNKFPEEIFNKLGEEGFFKVIIPEDQGGDGKGFAEHLDIVRGLAESNASVGLSYMMHNVALGYILRYGDEQVQDIIVKDVIENNVFCALGGTEASYGVDMSSSEFEVERSDDKIKLTGSKHMVTGGGYATWYMTVAPLETGSKETTQYFVSKNMNGISFNQGEWNGVGMRANNSVPMIYDNVEIESHYQVDPEETEHAATVDFFFFLLGLAGVYTGLNTALVNAAVQHTVGRTYPDGSNLASIETVQIHLADLYTNAFNAISTSKEAARSSDAKEPDSVLKVFSARINASENAIESSNIAMRIGGGKSYNKANAIERYMRDAYAGPVMTPSVDVLKLGLGGALGQQQ